MTDIKALWDDLQRQPLPGNLAQVAGGKTDAEGLARRAQECVRAFMAADALDNGKRRQLEQCLAEMRSINPKLVGEAQVYFGKLYRLCDLVYERAANSS